MAFVYNGKDVVEEKKAKLEKLSSVWVSQGLFSEVSASVRTAMGLSAIEGDTAGSLSPISLVMPVAPKQPPVSGGTSPSKTITSDSSMQVEDALRSLKPSPESDTWVSLENMPFRLVQVFHIAKQALDLERERDVEKEKIESLRRRININYEGAKSLPTLEEVTMRGWELERDAKAIEKFEEKVSKVLEGYKRLATSILRAEEDAKEFKKRAEEELRVIKADLDRCAKSKKFLVHRQSVLNGTVPDSKPTDIEGAPKRNNSTSANTPASDASKTSNQKQNSSAPPSAKAPSQTQQNDRSRPHDSRTQRQGPNHNRNGPPAQRNDDRNLQNASPGPRDGRDHRDGRDMRDHRDFRDSRDSWDGRQRDFGNYGRQDDYDDFRQPKRREDDNYNRRGPDSRHGYAQGDHGGRGGNENRGPAHGPASSNSVRDSEQRKTDGPNNTQRRGKDASNGAKKATETSTKQNNKTSESKPAEEASPANTTKRRNRESAGMQPSPKEAAGSKKMKTEEEEATAFYEE